MSLGNYSKLWDLIDHIDDDEKFIRLFTHDLCCDSEDTLSPEEREQGFIWIDDFAKMEFPTTGLIEFFCSNKECLLYMKKAMEHHRIKVYKMDLEPLKIIAEIKTRGLTKLESYIKDRTEIIVTLENGLKTLTNRVDIRDTEKQINAIEKTIIEARRKLQNQHKEEEERIKAEVLEDVSTARAANYKDIRSLKNIQLATIAEMTLGEKLALADLNPTVEHETGAITTNNEFTMKPVPAKTENRVPCQVCGKTFKTKQSMKVHNRKYHP